MTPGPISLYIPARNAEPTLGACLAAVRSQAQPPDECFILADPRSTDQTLRVARNSGLRVIEQTGPTLGAARNQAVAAATHRWVACCDADVLIQPDWLEKLAARRGERGAGGDSMAGIGGRTIERARGPADEWRALHMPHHWGEHAFKNPFMLVSEVLFDRRALLAVGGYRDDLNYYEDSDLCQRLREAGYDLLYEPAAVGVHQRTDDLLSVLALRWKYAEYRQRDRLDCYRGLLEKCAVNREYALNTLSRSLTRGREELAYVSYLLFFHHLVMDLRSMLSRRPLTPEGAKRAFERQLADVAIEAAAGRGCGIADWLRDDLALLCRPGEAAPDDAAVPPVWPRHLDAIRAAVERFCAELPTDVVAVIEASARHCHGRLALQAVLRMARPSPESLSRVLADLPLRPCFDADSLGAVRSLWPDLSGVRLIGPALESEHVVLRDGPQSLAADPRLAAIAPHLEARPDPLAAFREADAALRRLVVCYRPPERFVPGLDALAPADLAAAAAAAGWFIERFETLVGRTRLMLSR